MKKVLKDKPKKQKVDKTKISTSVQNDIVNTNQENIPESIKSANLLMDNRFKRRKTILTNRQVTKINTLDVIAQFYDLAWLRQWIDGFAEWRTSGDGGRGRSDVTDIFKFSSIHEQNKTKELIDMLRPR